MKKVININFQGRVIPIEETAYDALKQYIESLRRYFANEEGRDEIINDIESRIAELFAERLKKGAVCITDADVNEVMASMGRPEDFEAETNAGQESQSASSGQSQQQSSSSQWSYTGPGSASYAAGRGHLYRNADDKIIGGVASGLANYFAIDPIVMRILFVVLAAPLFWVYILLWIIIPSKSVQSNITKRLYRSADDKVLGGVCGGLAVYFNVSTWVPRLIFALPLLVGIISGPFNLWWNNWDWHMWGGPRLVSGSLGSTLFLTYIILWIALPVAVTSAEKLEMRGERVDLNSIRNTVKEDLESFKSKAQNWGSEVKQSAQQWGQKAKDFGQEASDRAKVFSAEAAPVARSAGNGIGHAIGVVFKAFFLLIAGSIALGLFAALMGLLFGGLGFAAFPLKEFILDGVGQNLLAWGVLLLFLGIPILALLTWLVRRIMGVRSRNHYLGYVFGTLWFVGLVCLIALFTSVGRNFKTRVPIEETFALVQPSTPRLVVDVQADGHRFYERGTFWGVDVDDEDWPFLGADQDTLQLRTVHISIEKSEDGLFHATKVRSSRGNTTAQARASAENIAFNIIQKDSVLLLPRGINISAKDKFRNQQIILVLEVPVGKRFYLSRSIGDYSWFDIRYNRRGINVVDRYSNDDNWGRNYWVNVGVEYVMTESGPKRADNRDDDRDDDERARRHSEPDSVVPPAAGNKKDSGYRYPQRTPATRTDTAVKPTRTI
ncbi:MAG: PspC domain-containing protein [Chitinophagaceae bacterium]